ncbi:MAG: alanyl-tRNA editing protein [Chloroflexota bacterium]
MATERLYHRDATARQFQARVLAQRPLGERVGVVLDRTLFYPTSGGQPHDLGLLGGRQVLDVYEEGAEIVHVLEAPLPEGAVEVEGLVDWQRRFDHMQQHTGQHILSQAFVDVLGAETVSFHLSEVTATIDVATTGLDAAQLAAVEELANRVVFEDRPIAADFVTPERLAQLPLRKPPKVSENIRIVEVAGFDWSACGGTHCERAGQVGLILVGKTERRGAETRVEFLCGGRALRRARRLVAHVNELANSLSVGWDDAVPQALRGLQSLKELDRELERLRAALQENEAAVLVAAAPRQAGVAVVSQVFPDRAPDELKRLALKLVAGERVVVLLAAQGQKGHLLCARSADVDCDMNAVLRAALGAIGGRGGGTPALAQGGAPDPSQIESALAVALEQVQQCLGEGQ